MKNKFNYQMVLVFSAKIEEKNRNLVFDKLEEMITKFGGSVDKKDHSGPKSFEYEIKKLNKGDFWDWTISSKTAMKINEINLFLNREPNIIRYLILKKSASADK